jgi:acetyl-CoA carboxylase biotin carboxyl carrier protein
VEQKDFRITIKQKEEQITQVISTPTQTVPIQSQVAQPPPVAAPQPPPSVEKAQPKTESSAEDFVTIKSPMIGTFYRRSGPDKPAFVEVGDEVAPGKVVCIIEAMKLFNEIESEVSGKIVKVLVEDASPVEYDQPLFLVEPA